MPAEAESDGEDILHSVMEHVGSSPNEERRIMSLLHHLNSSPKPTALASGGSTTQRHSSRTAAAPPPRPMGDDAYVAATLHLTPMQVGRLIELCAANDLPMPHITQLSQGMPSVTVKPANGHTLTVAAGDLQPLPPTPHSGRVSATIATLLAAQSQPSPPQPPPPGFAMARSMSDVVPPPSVPQPGDEAFEPPSCFGTFALVNPHGHESIRNPGKDVPLARMVLLKIPHGWGPAHMMDMLQRLGIKCYFARKHIKMGPRGEVSKGSGKVLIHEQEESKLMALSGAVWCVPAGFYRVTDPTAAAAYLEANKHQWGKHLPYELLKVEREEREQCEKSRVAMNYMGNPMNSGSGVLLSPNSYFDHAQISGGFRVSSMEEMSSLSPSGVSSTQFHHHHPRHTHNNRMSAHNNFMSASTMSLTSNPSSFEALLQ